MDLSFLLSSPSFKRENEDNEQGGVRTKKMKTKMKMKMKTKMKITACSNSECSDQMEEWKENQKDLLYMIRL